MRRPKKQHWSLTQEGLDQLLLWLDSDREQAGKKYEAIRTKLIRIFSRRGCRVSEELADKTIDRVARKVGEIALQYTGDPALYFYNVAQKIYLEHSKTIPFVELTENSPPKTEQVVPSSQDSQEDYHNCLDHCLERLDAQSRDLILSYYQEEKRAKINQRGRLAERYGFTISVLRMRIHRIKADLRQCVTECLLQGSS